MPTARQDTPGAPEPPERSTTTARTPIGAPRPAQARPAGVRLGTPSHTNRKRFPLSSRPASAIAVIPARHLRRTGMRSKPAPPLGARPDRYRAREAACTPPYGPDAPGRPTTRTARTPERRPTGHQDAARTGNGFRFRPARPRRRRVCTAGRVRLGKTGRHRTERVCAASQRRRSARYRADTAPSESRLYAALRAGRAPPHHRTARTPNGAPRDTRPPTKPETVSGIDQPPQSRRYRPGHGAGGKGIPGRQDSTREGPGTPLRHGRVRGFPENTP